MDRKSRVYPSKKDTWLVLLLAGASLFLAYTTVVRPILHPPRSIVPAAIASVIGVMGIGMVLGTLFFTHYVLDEDRLRIRGGVFKWEIPYDTIEKVLPSRSFLSGPALSLDRLEVRVKGTFVGVPISPEDKAAFLRDLVARCPQLILEGDRAVRREGA